MRFAKLAQCVAFVSATAFLLMLAGCGTTSKVAQNWSKVQAGMTEKQVADLLGKPKDKFEIDPNAWMNGLPLTPAAAAVAALDKKTVLWWEDDDKAYAVYLQGGKVVSMDSGSKVEMKNKNGK